MIANAKETSVAEIIIEIWRCLTPEKRQETLDDLEQTSGVLANEARYAVMLADMIVNTPEPMQA